MDDKILCPLVDIPIDVGDCVENVSVVDRMLKEESLPIEYKQKENWRGICKNCKYHNN